ncbi:MAG: sulfatase-like hydrolase/transferase [Planctomycetota bacterium]|nr:sulfatase-like hydrolase/transferase [Planctomycetota bacterium]
MCPNSYVTYVAGIYHLRGIQRSATPPLVVAPVKAPAPAPAPALPNFVFILADDQAWNGLSVRMIAGDDASKSRTTHTPNTQKLADSGVVFSQAYAAHPKCECSRASIICGRTTTSLNATSKSVRTWAAPVADSLANSLKRLRPEYHAAHFGKWQWSQTPASMGYDLSDGITQNDDGDSKDPTDPKQSFGITKRAHAFMAQEVKDGHPFYMQLSYYAVHQKPQALAETLKKYENGGAGDAGGARGARGAAGAKGAKGSKGGADRAVNAAMAEDLDTCVGAVLTDLEELGIAKNTYVIYMSDNGGRTEILKGGKGNLWEGGIRVPLIVAGPGVRAGEYCNVPVVSYDILPTVLDLAVAGTAAPTGVEGGSWRSVLTSGRDTAKVNRPIDRMVWHMPVEVEHPQSAMRQGDFKILYYWDTKQAQLFDLSKDPSETKDLSAEQPDRTAAMLAILKEHVRAGVGEEQVAALERGEKPTEGGGKPGPR